jgi:hypothetical protein
VPIRHQLSTDELGLRQAPMALANAALRTLILQVEHLWGSGSLQANHE